ncbi:MAG: translation initiation factor IF-3 [Planctomycetales bacterium]|nr:translation initiation factor IF-3 [Planctomycetales bacterium]
MDAKPRRQLSQDTAAPKAIGPLPDRACARRASACGPLGHQTSHSGYLPPLPDGGSRSGKAGYLPFLVVSVTGGQNLADYRQQAVDVLATEFDTLFSQHVPIYNGWVGFALSLRPASPRPTPVSHERTIAIDRSHVRINDQIRVTPIRVIDSEGNQLGVIATADALEQARDAGLDLVEVAPNEKPPVCRIMDYGKYKYQQSKKHHKGNVHHTKTKELRLRPKTGEHDIQFKLNRAKQFLKNRDKVQISVVFRGREIAHVDEGKRVIASVIEQLNEVGKLEVPPTQQGRRIVCTFAPK